VEHAQAIGRSHLPVASSFTASITLTASFPNHERGHDHGSDHVHGSRPRLSPGLITLGLAARAAMHCWQGLSLNLWRSRRRSTTSEARRLTGGAAFGAARNSLASRGRGRGRGRGRDWPRDGGRARDSGTTSWA
jgi:hypothetical protein